MSEAPQPVAIRPAHANDAGALAEIRTAAIARTGAVAAESTRLSDEEVDFLDRLSIPHGEDYFCLVAERGGDLVGYLIGGGSRDLDHKAHGEVYELAVEPSEDRDGIGGRLLTAAITSFDDAAFAGTLFSFPTADQATRRVAIAAGMSPLGEHPTVAGHIRFERPLPARRGR